MSFNKKYIHELDIVIKAIEDRPKTYYAQNIKADMFIGPSDSIKLTNEFIEKYSEDPEQDFSELTAKYKN